MHVLHCANARWALTQQHEPMGRRISARRDPGGTPEPSMQKKNGRNHRLRPSLNREASRLGDVRVRRPSSRALVPETIVDGWEPPETDRDRSSRAPNMAVSAHHYQTEFLLARLQKPQRCETQSK